jgi:hypothetical protein
VDRALLLILFYSIIVKAEWKKYRLWSNSTTVLNSVIKVKKLWSLLHVFNIPNVQTQFNRVCNSLVILWWVILLRDHFIFRFLSTLYRWSSDKKWKNNFQAVCNINWIYYWAGKFYRLYKDAYWAGKFSRLYKNGIQFSIVDMLMF